VANGRRKTQVEPIRMELEFIVPARSAIDHISASFSISASTDVGRTVLIFIEYR